MNTRNDKVVYESHITVDGSEEGLRLFKARMKECSIKVIKVGNGFPIIDYHHMTSVICHDMNDVTAVEQIVRVVTDSLKDHGVRITRGKLERSPTPKGSVTGSRYYECHVEVFSSAVTKKLYDPTYWFVSQNTNKFKSMPDGRLENLYMLTARMKNISLSAFTESVYSKMIPFVELIADKDKVFIEECVYDTCEQLDAHWMNIKDGSISSEEVLISA